MQTSKSSFSFPISTPTPTPPILPVQVYDFWKNQLDRFPAFPFPPSCSDEMAGFAGPSPPPPRSGLAMRLPALAKLKPVGDPRPRVEPALAVSRRSLTAASWTSNLERWG